MDYTTNTMLTYQVYDYCKKNLEPDRFKIAWARYVEKQDQMRPTIPEDGTAGYLAFSHNGKRFKTTTGRFLAKKCSLNTDLLTCAQIEQLANVINAELFPQKDIKIVSGQALQDAYRDSVGCCSCMTAESSEYVGLYRDNPDRFQLLIMHHTGNSARALIMKLDSGDHLLNRVYSDNFQKLFPMMKDYAQKNGWYYYEDGCVVDKNGTIVNSQDLTFLKISGLIFMDGEIPYVDLLCSYKLQLNATVETMTIGHWSAIENSDGDLQRTDGSLKEKDSFYCESCDRYCDGESFELPNGDLVCEYCRDKYYTRCDHCDDLVDNDDATGVHGRGYYCHSCIDEHAFKCPHCDEYYLLRDGYTIHERRNCNMCCEDYYSLCDQCKEYFHENDLTDHDGQNLCDECLTKIERETNEPQHSATA